MSSQAFYGVRRQSARRHSAFKTLDEVRYRTENRLDENEETFCALITALVRWKRTKRELSMQHFETPPFPADYSGEAVRALYQGWTQTEWIEKQVGAEKVRKQTARFGGGRIDWTPSSAKVRRGRCDVRSSGDRVVVLDDALNLYTLDDDFQHVPTRDILKDVAPSRDDVAALFGRVDVSSHVTKELLDKLKSESDKGEWKERSEALDTIQAIFERAGCAIAFTHPVQDVVRLLKDRLSDANANIKVKAANVLATIATSVGPDIAKMSKLLGPSLIAGVADNKKAMQAAALHLLHQWFFRAACLPDLAAAFATAFPPPFALGGRFCCWGLAVFFAPLSDLFLKLPKFFLKAFVDELLYVNAIECTPLGDVSASSHGIPDGLSDVCTSP
ncbi:hypothetical protein PsorP6_006802 [Peronosclerospora sorghi]|uniref:Uncharacterized protein n=1 Tax=Peronosclerospora sorghi TaxID=230839 RepID=A0ACC0W7P8_9STRA|nr:hypothetical protein PsorP6_006802 [Peronosclerospora sorghi]